MFSKINKTKLNQVFIEFGIKTCDIFKLFSIYLEFCAGVTDVFYAFAQASDPEVCIYTAKG